MENNETIPMRFRTAINGYRKEDVNRYISYINSNFKGVEATLKNTITGQKDELIRLGEETAALRDALAQKDAVLQEQPNGTEGFDGADERVEVLLAEKAALEEENNRLTAELQTLREWKNRADTIPVASEELIAKASQYDLIAAGIGTWMQNATEQAQAVVDNARVEAQKIIDNANSQVNQETVETTRREMNDQFRRLTENRCQGLVAKIGTVQSGLSTLMDEIQRQYSEMDLMIEQADTDVQTSGV